MVVVILVASYLDVEFIIVLNAVTKDHAAL